jgi:hypothetical protein
VGLRGAGAGALGLGHWGWGSYWHWGWGAWALRATTGACVAGRWRWVAAGNLGFTRFGRAQSCRSWANWNLGRVLLPCAGWLGPMYKKRDKAAVSICIDVSQLLHLGLGAYSPRPRRPPRPPALAFALLAALAGREPKWEWEWAYAHGRLTAGPPPPPPPRPRPPPRARAPPPPLLASTRGGARLGGVMYTRRAPQRSPDKAMDWRQIRCGSRLWTRRREPLGGSLIRARSRSMHCPVLQFWLA